MLGLPTILEGWPEIFYKRLLQTMKTTLSYSTPSELETEALVAIALDQSEKDQSAKDQSAKNGGDKKAQLKLATADAAVQSAGADLLASGELTGKPFETNLLHKPAAL